MFKGAPYSYSFNAEASAPSITIWVENYPALVAFYGVGFADQVLNRLCARVISYTGGSGVLVGVHGVGRTIDIWCHGQERDWSEDPYEVEALLVAVSVRPVVVNGVAVVVAVSTSPGLVAVDFTGRSVTGRAITEAVYRRSMDEAAAAFDACLNGRLGLAVQSVRSVKDNAQLYSECLTRIFVSDDGSDVLAPSAFIPAIERLGLSRVFDRFVVLQTIETLRRDPDACLGCNISAQSAVDDEYWVSVFETLKAEPDVARRLVVEVTETAALCDVDIVRGFVARLQKLGCRFALDDFGAGHSSVGQVFALRPDIVKIDGSFLRDTAEKNVDEAFLSHVIGLLVSLTAQVVVEGVESEEDLILSRRVGAHWVQGYHIDRPGLKLRLKSRASDQGVRDPAYSRNSSNQFNGKGD